MQKQEKGSPPQFMSTHPSVGLASPFQSVIRLLTFPLELQQRGSHSWMVRMLQSISHRASIANFHRLEKAESIYEDNGCSSVGRYSKILSTNNGFEHELTLVVPGFHDAAKSYTPSYGR